MICVNGDIVAQASQFSLRSVEVITAVVDIVDVRNFRGAMGSFQEQASAQPPKVPVINLSSFSLSHSSLSYKPVSRPVPPRIHTPEEECALGPACWLWDYLRRSGASGYLLPLSGGADSAAVATIVYVMSCLAVTELEKGNEEVQEDVRRIINRNVSVGDGKDTHADLPKTGAELCAAILHTIYMGTVNSSSTTEKRACKLATQIGCYHLSFRFDAVVNAITTLFASVTGHVPNFQIRGGTRGEDLALQNIQARIRMVVAYLFAQLLPWVRSLGSGGGGSGGGFLLVLGSSNVDEALRGYFTKYDCSSADIAPIGGICKQDLKRMLLWAAGSYGIDALSEITHAVPTAELRPIEGGVDPEESSGAVEGGGAGGASSEMYTQADEDEMGMTYAELGVFGVLRKIRRCGPVSMFLQLCDQWSHLKTREVAEKVKRFFYFYAINRHKMTTLTPSYHAENYSPDDNRFDLRPFLYNAKWSRQFRFIDLVTEEKEAA
eukprot:gene4404-5581_t